MGGGANLPRQSRDSNSTVELLILGAGWTSTFLVPLLQQKGINYAATTTTGRDGTYKFRFNPDDSDGNKEQLCDVPTARCILITFPLKGKGQSRSLVEQYSDTHSTKSFGGSPASFQFIQLGSTGIFDIPGQSTWVTRHSLYNVANDRAIAEDELIELGGCVLNLSGLWGGERNAKHWIERVASSKEMLSNKKSLHMVHGLDVSRGIVGVIGKWEKAKGQRFMLTDLMVYDWWALILGYAGEIDEETGDGKMEGRQIKWIGELMKENNVRALPRSMDVLGRCYDSREFWESFDVMPVRSRI
ncbi:210bc1bf-244e-42de-bd2b-456101b8d96c [Sclerotinia trifoliorum]|uniref:210bc1bf-244e-42de-bd2b-456101b8d96c n=1 Tax=Sclerotinia trifoliorum TaxID=28548 RepID=A0A8H2VYI8_9HELO|nr:210bc1bf-244e-42de-bd2b-456101b8d96c [Sclerotinia trifoliorum]